MEVFQFFMSLLQAIYEGGLDKFHEDGGELSIVPAKTPEVLVYHPNLPIIVKNKLLAISGKLSIKTVFVTTKNTTPDMETFDIDEANKKFEALRKRLNIPEIMVHQDDLQVCIGVRGEISSKQSEDLANGLNELMPCMIRIYVTSENACTRYEYAIKEPVITKSMVMLEATQRTTVISNDDLLNLSIALETANTVDEFLAQL
jgi:hypothetical protein